MQRSWGRSDSALPPPAAALACCLLLCLGQAACTVVLPFGAVLDDLPGAAAAQAASGAGWPSNVSISLVDETVQIDGPPGSPPLLVATMKLFRNDGTNQTFTFGPTIRVHPGDAFQVAFANALRPAIGTHEELEGDDNFNKLRLPQTTNLHLHGVYSDPGVYEQPEHDIAEHGVAYSGGDNVFVRLASGQSNTYTYSVPANHMPGLYWMHPHFMGSPAFGTASAKSAVVIEGNEAALLSPPNCSNVLQVLQAAQERVLIVEPWMFDSVTDSYPDLSSASTPPNPTCCEDNLVGAAFNSSQQAILTINGGMAPVIRMRSLHATGGPDPASPSFSWPDRQPAGCNLRAGAAWEGWHLADADSQERATHAADRRRQGRCVGALRGPAWSAAPPAAPCFASQLWQQWRSNQAAGSRLPVETCSTKHAPRCAPAMSQTCRTPPWRPQVVRQSVVFSPADPENPSEDCLVNGEHFSLPDSSPLVASLGKVMEWTLGFVTLHPHHLHTQPVQITALPLLAAAGGDSGAAGEASGRRGLRQKESGMEGEGEAPPMAQPSSDPANLARWAALTPYFRVGDWHDTIMLPVDSPLGGAAAVRFMPGPWSGYSVTHCHFLMHEDVGCMKVVKWECNPGEKQPGVCVSWEAPVPGTY